MIYRAVQPLVAASFLFAALSSARAQTGPGYALSFAGTGDYVSVPNAPSLNPTTAVTLEAWVRAAAGVDRYIMSKGDDSFYLGIGPDGTTSNKLSFYLLLSGGNSGWLQGTTSLNDNLWHHVAATYDGVTLRVYVDGLLENSRAGSGTLPTGTSPVRIGGRLFIANTFDGLMDEVRIWNVARSQSDIQANMWNTALAANTPGLVAYWHFDAGSGTNATDATSNSNTGTFVNGPIWAAFPSLTPGNPAALTPTSETLSGSINPRGTIGYGWFNWGTTTNYGTSTAATSVGNGSSPVAINTNLSGLTPGVAYHYRIVGSNMTGVTYGADQVFNVFGVATLPPTNVSGASATLNGVVTNIWLLTSGWFQWGATTNYGNTTPAVPLGNGSGPVSMNAVVNSLTPGVLYHYRAIATNSTGSYFGPDQSFVADNVVTTTNDTGGGSLRQSISQAAPGATVTYAVSGTIGLQSPLIVDRNLTIVGPGSANLAIRGNGSVGPLVTVPSGISASISGLTVRNGISGIGGGGIYNGGSLTLTDCVISNNTTSLSAYPNGGGGVYNEGSLTFTGCTIAGNYTSLDPNSTNDGGPGGGIYNKLGSVNLNNCVVSNNLTAGSVNGGCNGGGIWSSGLLALNACLLNGNRTGAGGYGGFNGGDGGGIYSSGSLTLSGCTLSENVTGTGGDYGSDKGGNGGNGGGIYNSGLLVLNDCTVNGNSTGKGGYGDSGPDGSAGGGGGIYSSGSLSLIACTISGNISGYGTNHPASLGYGGGIYGNGNLRNTLIAMNLAAGGGRDVFGTNTSLGHNLLGIINGGAGITNGVNWDLAGTLSAPLDPRIAELSNYGGPTETCPLLLGSPAIDAGDDTVIGAGISTDQRGVARKIGAHVDIGAFEYLAGDLDTNGVVDANELNMVLASFNNGVTDTNALAAVLARLNGDGTVNQSELNLVLAAYYPNSPWLYLTNVAGLGGTNVTFALSNSTAGAFSVLYSTNLMDWIYLGPATPRYLFTDTNAPGIPQRYYRLRYP